MIKTHGLTHISLKVSDMDKSVQFYKDVFGVVEYYRDEQNVGKRARSERHPSF
jgi:catechol 2,3-dioxygenase-like lactoylglutathione lyase family enzyme